MHAPVGKCNVAVAALLDEEECQVMSTEKGFQCRYKSRFHRKGVRKSALGISCCSHHWPIWSHAPVNQHMLGIRDTRYQELGQPQRWLQQLQREQDRGRGRQKGLTGEEQASLPPSLPPSYWMPCRMLYISKRTKLRLK